MKSRNIEQRKCVICGKEYTARKSRRGYYSRMLIRGVNTITCSKLCSSKLCVANRDKNLIRIKKLKK